MKYLKSIIYGFIMAVILVAIGIVLGHLMTLAIELDIKFFVAIIVVLATAYFSWWYFKYN